MPQPHIQIFRCTAARLRELQEIGKTTFLEAFEKDNQPENIHAYVAAAFCPQKLLAELKNEFSRFYLAEIGGEVAGYLKVNFGPAQTDVHDDRALEIERIYTRKKYYGRGVGQRLFEQAVEVARQNHLQYMWLGVWERNDRAICFYEKNGFTKFGSHIFKVGEDEQIDILMRYDLHDKPGVR